MSDLLPFGVHFGISEEEYNRDPGCRQSDLKKFIAANTPAHFKWEQDHPEEDKDYLRIGRFVDCSVFYPDKVNEQFIVWTGGRRYGKEWDKFEAANTDKAILSVDELTRGNGTVASMLAHEDAAAALKCSHHQVVIIAEHPAFKIRMKGRLDMLPKKDIGWIWDWKSGADASAKAFHKQCGDLGYHIQAAYYEALLEYAPGGRKVDRFGFFVGETSQPHAVDTHYFEKEDLLHSNRLINNWLPIFHKCKTENNWPSYSKSWKRIKIPYWMEREEPMVTVLY